MAYFPASCDYCCKDCSRNKCGWCDFYDCPTPSNQAETINPYYYPATIKNNEDEK